MGEGHRRIRKETGEKVTSSKNVDETDFNYVHPRTCKVSLDGESVTVRPERANWYMLPKLS